MITVTRKSEYPIYKKARCDTSLIVRFDALCTGVVVSATNDAFIVGYRSTMWTNHLDTGSWLDVDEVDLHCIGIVASKPIPIILLL